MHFRAAHHLPSFVFIFVKALVVDIGLANVMDDACVPLTSITVIHFALFLMKQATTNDRSLSLALYFIFAWVGC